MYFSLSQDGSSVEEALSEVWQSEQLMDYRLLLLTGVACTTRKDERVIEDEKTETLQLPDTREYYLTS